MCSVSSLATDAVEETSLNLDDLFAGDTFDDGAKKVSVLSVSLLTNYCEDADSDNGVLLSVLPVSESCAMESDATSFESAETLESIAISGSAGICALSESEGRCDVIEDDAVVVVLDTPLAVGCG